MYADTGLIFPTSYTFSPDIQQFCDLSYSYKSNVFLDSVVQSCDISDYDLGGEGDLFKAPEPIMEQLANATFDAQELELNDELLNNVFHDYKEILESEISPLSEVLNYKFPVESSSVKENVHPPGQMIIKSMSSGCLDSLDRVQGPQNEPGLVDGEFGNVYGMRRAFSDGDIKALANGSETDRRPSLAQPQLMSDHATEDRWQKLARYRNKRSKRNFGRTIKYACRKALADNQPRIRGRFAKTEERETWRN